MSDERKPRESDRAQAEKVEADTRAIQESTTQRFRKKLHSIDSSLDLDRELQRYLEEQKGEDDSVTRDVRAVAAKAGITFPTSLDRPPSAVLVVVDEAAAVRAIAQALSSKGFIVYSARSGTDGLKQLETMLRCDCIVIDLGIQTFVNARQFILFVEGTKFAAVPMVVLDKQPPPVLQRLRGALTYVPKPLDYGRLVTAVQTRIEAEENR